MNKKRKLKFLSFLLVTALLINSFMASVSYAKPKVKLNKTKITLTLGNSVLFSRTQRAKRKLACTWRLRAGQTPRCSAAGGLTEG
ncbi:hypothetical protein D7V82_16285 [bacterium 1xD8-6]|nr:hypothetical protein D7V72_11900 [bacterium D16-36]RKI65572.1 hypothetical protein D7V82_16285 [bacterium 1xD8-6]